MPGDKAVNGPKVEIDRRRICSMVAKIVQEKASE